MADFRRGSSETMTWIHRYVTLSPHLLALEKNNFSSNALEAVEERTRLPLGSQTARPVNKVKYYCVGEFQSNQA